MAMDTAISAVKLAFKIKDIIEQSARNEEHLIDLAIDIHGDCKLLQKAYEKTHKGKKTKTAFDDALKGLNRQLERLYKKLEKLIPRWDSGFRNLVKAFCRSILFSKETKAIIKSIRNQARDARDRFVMKTAMAQLEVSEDINEKVNWIAKQMKKYVDDDFVGGLRGDDLADLAEEEAESDTSSIRKKPKMKKQKDKEETQTISNLASTVVRLCNPTTLLAKQRRGLPSNFDFFDSAEKCFRADADEEAVIADLNELIKSAKSPPSAIEWLNSAMLLSPSLLDMGFGKEALQLAEACCSMSNAMSKQEQSIFYKVAEAGCHANLSIILSEREKPWDALGQAHEACLRLEEATDMYEKRSASSRSEDSYARTMDAKSASYSHILLNCQYELGRFSDAARSFDDEFGSKRKPDLSFLKDLDVADSRIGLYLIDRWKVYLKLEKKEKTAHSHLRAALELLKDDEMSPESIPVLKKFLQLSATLNAYSKERIDVSTYIYMTLMECKRSDEAFEALQTAVGLLRSFFDSGSTSRQKTFAKYLLKLAFALRRRRKSPESITIAQEAVRVWEKIRKEDSTNDFYRERQSFVLRKLAAWQLIDCQSDGAAENARKAVQLLRKLSEEDQQKYGLRYGQSLSTLADAEAQRGDADAARKYAKSALDILMDTITKFEIEKTTARAEALFVYGKLLVNKDLAKACTTLDEAVQEYQDALGESKLTSLKFQLAATADEAALAHLKHRKFKAAMIKSKLAVAIVKKLYDKAPRHAVRLADVMETKVECLLEQNKLDQAYDVANELYLLRSKVADERKPDRPSSLKLAVASMLQAICASRKGDYNNAINQANGALKVAEKESKLKPNDFVPTFFYFLRHLSSIHQEDGNNDKALKFLSRAITYARPFERGSDFDILEKMAEASFSSAKMLVELARAEDAVAELTYTVDAYHDLFSNDRVRFVKPLFAALDLRQKQLVKLGRQKEIVQVLYLKVNVRREQGKDGRAELAEALNQLSVQQEKAGDEKGGLDSSEEAVKFARKLSGAANEEKLGLYLATLGMRHRDAGDTVAAKKTFKESKELLEKHSDASSARASKTLKSVQKELKTCK